jgi:thiamine monophosphate synthase
VTSTPAPPPAAVRSSSDGAAGRGPGAPLGPLLVLTDRSQCRRPLPEVIAAAVDAGARCVVLREKDLPDPERLRLVQELGALLAPVGGRLVLAGPPLPGADVPAVHLSAADDVPDPRPPLLGRSCHDLASVRRAAAQGCDWVTVSPVSSTPSKPGYGPALGRDGLAALTGCGVPSYTLGGVTAENAPACLTAGAAGVAVMGAVMRADRPDEVVAGLLARLAEGAPR